MTDKKEFSYNNTNNNIVSIINRRNPQRPNIEKTRLISDNLNVYIESSIITPNQNKSFKLNLSDEGLKSFSYDARDDINIFKPVTKLEEVCIVDIKGFDLNFTFGKNSPNIMKLIMDQFTAYHGGMNLNIANTKNNEVNHQLINKNFRTHITDVKPLNQKNNIRSNVYGVAYVTNNPVYVIPEFNIIVNIQHYNRKVETLIFKRVKLFKPKMSATENSSQIEESITGFAPIVEPDGSIEINTDINDIIYNNLKNLLLESQKTENLSSNDRLVLNYDNLQLFPK